MKRPLGFYTSSTNPNHPIELVRRTYFPQRGVYFVSHLVGRPRAEIEAKFAQMQRIQKIRSQTMRRLFKDPEFRARHVERGRRRMKKLYGETDLREVQRQRARRRLQDPDFERRFREGARQAVIQMHAQPGFKAALRETMRQKAIALWKNPRYRTMKKEDSRRTMQRLHLNPTFREKSKGVQWRDPSAKRKASERLKARWRDTNLRQKMTGAIKAAMQRPAIRAATGQRMRQTALKLWQDPGYRAMRVEAARKLWERPGFRARMIRQSRQTMNLLNADPAFRAASTAALKKLWRDPHYRLLQQARANLRAHKRRLERAVNFFEAQKPGGWEVDVGVKERRSRRVAVHIPQMEEAIDQARAMRKMLAALPARQRVLLSHFFDINLQHSDKAIREAQDLQPHEVDGELKAAMETLKQSPVWKKLLEE